MDNPEEAMEECDTAWDIISEMDDAKDGSPQNRLYEAFDSQDFEPDTVRYLVGLANRAYAKPEKYRWFHDEFEDENKEAFFKFIAFLEIYMNTD